MDVSQNNIPVFLLFHLLSFKARCKIRHHEEGLDGKGFCIVPVDGHPHEWSRERDRKLLNKFSFQGRLNTIYFNILYLMLLCTYQVL